MPTDSSAAQDREYVGVDDAQQMCAAPSDTYSAGQWCEAANALSGAVDHLREEVERRATENARLQDGVIQMVNTLWAIYEQAQSVARKPSPT